MMLTQNGGLRLPLNNKPHSTKAVYPCGSPRKQGNCKKFWIFITFVFCDSVNHDTVVMHPSSIQVSKKCVFLEQICRFSVPNFQEVLSHHVYFLLISLFFVFYFICLLFRFFLFLFSPLLSVHLFPFSSPFLLIPVSSVCTFLSTLLHTPFSTLFS